MLPCDGDLAAAIVAWTPETVTPVTWTPWRSAKRTAVAP